MTKAPPVSAAAPSAGTAASAPPRILRRQILVGAPVPGPTEVGDLCFGSFRHTRLYTEYQARGTCPQPELSTAFFTASSRAFPNQSEQSWCWATIAPWWHGRHSTNGFRHLFTLILPFPAAPSLTRFLVKLIFSSTFIGVQPSPLTPFTRTRACGGSW